MARDENKDVVRRFFEEALSTSNLDLMDELFAPNYVHHGMVAGSPDQDREASKQQAATFFAAFPDLRISVHDQVAEDDTVVARYTMHGTHRGEFLGVPASGHQLSVSGIGCFRLEDARFVEHWPGLDVMGMMQQLGANTHTGRSTFNDR